MRMTALSNVDLVLFGIGESFVTSLFTFCFIIHFQVDERNKIKLNIKFKKASRGKYWTKLSFMYMQF